MKQRYYMIYGLDEGEPIRPYYVDTKYADIHAHLETYGDKARHAWPVSEASYIKGADAVNLFVRSDGFPVRTFAEFEKASPSCFSLPALAILWMTYGPERLVALQSDMLNDPIILERMEDDFTEWTASEVWAAVSALDYDAIEDMAAGVFQGIVDEDIQDADASPVACLSSDAMNDRDTWRLYRLAFMAAAVIVIVSMLIISMI